MTAPFPTPFELAQLAASNRFRALSRELAVKEALIFWMKAIVELYDVQKHPETMDLRQQYQDLLEDQNDRERDCSEQADEYFAKRDDPENQTVRLGKSEETSEAMDIIRLFAKDDRDKFKSFARFRQAWIAWGNWKPDPDLSVPKGFTTLRKIKEFLESREKSRREASTRRAQKRRETAGLSKKSLRAQKNSERK
jgi:hypothetical protein